jgi:type I restriction enzyme M protein
LARPAHTSNCGKKLVEDYELLAVISLPAGVFKPYAGVKTGILVIPQAGGKSVPLLGENREESRTSEKARYDRKVWFYQINNDGL